MIISFFKWFASLYRDPLQVLLTPLVIGIVLVAYLILLMPFYDNVDDETRQILWFGFVGIALAGMGSGLYAIAFTFLYDATESRRNKILQFDDISFCNDNPDIMTFKEYWGKKHGTS